MCDVSFAIKKGYLLIFTVISPSPTPFAMINLGQLAIKWVPTTGSQLGQHFSDLNIGGKYLYSISYHIDVNIKNLPKSIDLEN